MELISSSQIYWFTRIDSLHSLSIAIILIGVFGIIITSLAGLIVYNEGKKENKQNVVKYSKIAISVCFSLLTIGSLTSVFLPTQKEMAAIYLIPVVVNNPNVQKTAQNLMESTTNVSAIALQYTEKWVQEQINDNTVQIIKRKKQ